MLIEPHAVAPLALYKALVGGIIPRPIAWVSTVNASGLSNLAPYSFFSVASCNPPILTITNVPSGDRLAKDTLTNLLETKACVVNIVTATEIDNMNASCANYSPQQSEIEVLGIETVASYKVQPCGVKASPVRYECTLREVMTLSDQPMGGVLILLDVVAIYIDDCVLEGGMINANLLNAVGKLGANDYALANSDFTRSRPER